jgi:hypothetical protein
MATLPYLMLKTRGRPFNNIGQGFPGHENIFLPYAKAKRVVVVVFFFNRAL